MSVEKDYLLHAAKFLELASDHFGRHGCNDTDQSLFRYMTQWEKEQMAKEYNEYNSMGEDPCTFEQIPDYAWMGFFAYKLTKMFWED